MTFDDKHNLFKNAQRIYNSMNLNEDEKYEIFINEFFHKIDSIQNYNGSKEQEMSYFMESLWQHINEEFIKNNPNYLK
jgi:siderophore synthetase component